MARVTRVKAAQQRYKMIPKTDPVSGEQVVVPVLTKRVDDDGNRIPKTTKHGKEVTRRVTVADRDQPLPMPTCGKCGTTIEVGAPYKHVTTKSGPYGGRTLYRCDACPTWRQSELSSSKMAGVYAAQEQAADQIADCDNEDALQELASDLASQIREVADEYRESADNMVDGFGHETYVSDALVEKADELEGWADEIENLDFEAYEETDCGACDGEGVHELPDGDEDCTACDGTGVDDGFDHWEEQRSLLDGLINECPV